MHVQCGVSRERERERERERFIDVCLVFVQVESTVMSEGEREERE